MLPALRRVPALVNAALAPLSAPPKLLAKMDEGLLPCSRNVAPAALCRLPVPARLVLLRLKEPAVQVRGPSLRRIHRGGCRE